MLHNQPRLNTFQNNPIVDCRKTNLHLLTKTFEHHIHFSESKQSPPTALSSNLLQLYPNHIVPMARSKRVPLQRQPSDFSAAPPDPDIGWRTGAVNGSIPVEKRQTDTRTINTGPQEMLADVIPTEQAGLTHLLICVGGIYASL